jgi:hypothetical protein
MVQRHPSNAIHLAVAARSEPPGFPAQRYEHTPLDSKRAPMEDIDQSSSNLLISRVVLEVNWH